jgi:hypothetical protein
MLTRRVVMVVVVVVIMVQLVGQEEGGKLLAGKQARVKISYIGIF